MTAVAGRLRKRSHGFQMALIVTRREVRDAYRDWRIVIPIVLLTLVFPLLATLTARVLINFTARYGGTILGERMIPFLLLIVGFFPMSFSLVIALETFVGEKERKSLEPLLATPLTDMQLYLGKMLAAIIPPMVTSYLGILVYLIGLVVLANWVLDTTLVIQILAISTIQGVIMVAAAVIVSSQTTTVRAANLLASFIIVPIAILLQIEAVILFWGNVRGLWWLILALVVLAVILIRMGVRIFNREELLGQDIDQLRLGWIWWRWWNRFTGRFQQGSYPGVIGWYRQLFQSLPKLKLPAGALLISVVGALALGAYLAGLFGSSAALQEELIGVDFVANTSALRLQFASLPIPIFIQNVRAIIVVAILGIFTLGVTDVLFFMLPWALIGFLASLLAQAGHNPLTFVFATIVPHGVIEMLALLLAGAALFRWHAAVLERPADKTLSENWLQAAADFGRIFVGVVIPLLFVAAFIESRLTPQVILWVYGN